MSRGKQKHKLRDYSSMELTSEQRQALSDAVIDISWHPIATAILGGVMVEHEIEILMRRRIKRANEMWSEMVEERGPLRSFSTKIMLGYALGLFDAKMKHDVNVIRTIRNAFAHSKTMLHFDDALVVRELLSAHLLAKPFKRSLQKRPPPGSHPDAQKRTAQAAYVVVCFVATTKLINMRSRATSAATRARRERLEKKFANSPIAQALLGLTPNPQLQGLTYPSIFASLDQSGGSRPKAPVQLTGGLFGLGPTKPE